MLHLRLWVPEGFSLLVCMLDHEGWHDHWPPCFLSAPLPPLVSSAWFFPADASRSCFDCGRRPSIKMFSCTNSLYPCVGVFLSSLWKRSSASLSDSSGNWWNKDISIFPSAVFDSGKYFFRNFSTTSPQVHKLLPLKECNHLFASLAKEKEKRAYSSFRDTSYFYRITNFYVGG